MLIQTKQASMQLMHVCLLFAYSVCVHESANVDTLTEETNLLTGETSGCKITNFGVKL